MAALSKGAGPVSAEFAVGGPVLTSKSRFVKDKLTPADDTVDRKVRAGKSDDAPTTVSQFLDTPDVFRRGIEKNQYDKKTPGGELSVTKGDNKSKKPLKPRG